MSQLLIASHGLHQFMPKIYLDTYLVIRRSYKSTNRDPRFHLNFTRPKLIGKKALRIVRASILRKNDRERVPGLCPIVAGAELPGSIIA